MTHHILDLLRGALVHYGYWAVAAALLLENAGVPVPGETVLLLACFLAYSERSLNLGWIILIGTAAATVGDNLGFLIGHYGGPPLLAHYERFRAGAAAVKRGEKLFTRYGALTILFARFIFGLRIIAGPLAGVLRMPWKKFAIFNFLGAGLWVAVVSFVGYSFGSRWNLVVDVMRRFDLAVGAIVVIVALALWWRSRRSQQRPRDNS